MPAPKAPESPRRRWPRIAGITLALVLIAGALAAANRDRVVPMLLRLDPEMRASPHFTDEAEAGPDFLVQGEYVDARGRWAAQIIALGDGRFDAKIYEEGLPGAGWNRRQPRSATGRTTTAGIVFSGAVTGSLREGRLALDAPDGSNAILTRVQRQSPTLGAAPPPGAVVLFRRGKNEFHGSTDEHDRLMEGATTKDAFRDFSLHLEFRTPFEPGLTQQKRGNSGVYLQKRYELQVLDSFGLEGEHDECGGIYKQRRPDVNMAFPPLAWQTYDIDFRAARFEGDTRVTPARMTVRHNGTLIHDDVELTGPTGLGAPETPAPGPIFLQDHGNPVRYRNVWLVPR